MDHSVTKPLCVISEGVGLVKWVSPEASPTSWRGGLGPAWCWSGWSAGCVPHQVWLVGGLARVAGVPVISAPRRVWGMVCFGKRSGGRNQADDLALAGVMTQPRSQPARVFVGGSRGRLEAADVAVAESVVGERDDAAGHRDLGDLAVVRAARRAAVALMQQRVVQNVAVGLFALRSLPSARCCCWLAMICSSWLHSHVVGSPHHDRR